MWLFTEIGFYSINLTPDETALQFRARKKSDLENLRREFPKHFPDEIMTLPSADYRWRLETTPAQAALVMFELTKRISYRNFKNHLHDTDQTDKLPILHDLWSSMYAYQGRQERPKSYRPEYFARHDDEPFFGALDEHEERAQGELSDWLAGWPNPEDEDDSLAPPPDEESSFFPDWDGPNRYDVNPDADDDPFDTSEHYPKDDDDEDA